MSRDFLPAPVEFPGRRRRKPKRRRHRSHRSHRSSSEGRGSSRPDGRHRSDASVLTEEPDGIAPLEPQPNRPPRRRRKRGIGHRYRKWRSRSKRKQYKVFMGGRGASTREIQRRYERSRKRRKRLVVGAVTALVLGAFGVAMGDAYLQASRVLDKVRASGESLKQVRSNLIRGKLPPEDAFASAAKAIGEAQEQVNVARPTWEVVRTVPFIGLPVSATEHLLDASRHELNAAIAAKELLESILGQTIEEAQAEADEAAARREEADADGSGSLTPEERKALKQQGLGPQPGDKPKEEPVQDDPDALLSNGRVNLEALRALIPQVQTLETELAAAEEAVEAIGEVPFVSKVEDLRLDLIGEIQESRRLATRALSGLNFIPAFLGGNEQKNYLLLFADSGYLRGTGGAYFAYAEISVKSGKLSLVNQGPIIDLDRYVNEPVDHVIPPDNWYLDTFGLSKRMNNLNWDPHFPNTAPVAAEIYKIRTAGKDINGVVKPEGREVDGVFQIDITGVSYLVDAIGPIDVDSWPVPIGGGNLERVALIDSYVELSSGTDDASDSGKARKAFNEDLVEATWRSLQEPDDLVRTVFQLSRALAERHMQVWVRSKEQQAFFVELGMAGAIKNQPGDYLYAVDQNLGDDTLDVFASERVEYDVTVSEEGDLDVTATVKTTNFVDASMPYPIIDNDGRPPTKKTYVHLYAPANAELQSVLYRDRFTQYEPKQIEPKLEAGRKVFSAKMSIKPQETSSLIFKYTIPGGLLDEDGDVYRLLIQRQPRYVDQSIRVRVTYPEDWEPEGYDDEVWTVSGHTAEAFIPALEEDAILELRF